MFNLYKNEISKLKKETILFVALSLLLNIFFLYKSYNGWSPQSAVGLNGFILPMTFFIPLILSESKFITQEWKDNTIYLMMSLPIKSKDLFLVKFLAVITQYIVLSLSSAFIFGIQIIIFLKRTNLLNKNLELTKELFSTTSITSYGLLYILSISILAYLVSIVFLSSITGKVFKKHSGIITFVLGFGMLMISGKAIGYLMNTVFSLIDISVDYINQAHIEFAYACLIGSIIIFLITALIYFVTCKIYDKKVEL